MRVPGSTLAGTGLADGLAGDGQCFVSPVIVTMSAFTVSLRFNRLSSTTATTGNFLASRKDLSGDLFRFRWSWYHSR